MFEKKKKQDLSKSNGKNSNTGLFGKKKDDKSSKEKKGKAFTIEEMDLLDEFLDD